MTLKSYASRLKMISHNNHCAHIADVVALATLVARMQTAKGV